MTTVSTPSNQDIMAQLRLAIAKVQADNTARPVVIAPVTTPVVTAPRELPVMIEVDGVQIAVLDSELDGKMGNMPIAMKRVWAARRKTAAYSVITGWTANDIPLNKWGQFIGKADPTHAGTVVPGAKPVVAKTPAPVVVTPAPATDTTAVLAQIAALLNQLAAPAPVVAAPAPVSVPDATITLQALSDLRHAVGSKKALRILLDGEAA